MEIQVWMASYFGIWSIWKLQFRHHLFIININILKIETLCDVRYHQGIRITTWAIPMVRNISSIVCIYTKHLIHHTCLIHSPILISQQMRTFQINTPLHLYKFYLARNAYCIATRINVFLRSYCKLKAIQP